MDFATLSDNDLKNELELYMENDFSLYSQKKSILKNIARKIKSGKYDHNLALKLWIYWVNAGAKSYAAEFGSQFKFPKKARESLAKYFADEEKAKLDAGEYSIFLSK